MDRKPDFERVIKAIRHEEPDRVPLAELQIDPPIIEASLGRKIRGVEDEIRFWADHGYDFYCPLPHYPIGDIVQYEAHTDKYRTDTDEESERHWAPEHAGVIRNMDDLEKLPWRDPVDGDFASFAEAEKHLPDGMALIAHVGGFFEFVWQLMGFEMFSYALIDNPELIERLNEKVCGTLFAFVEGAIGFDSVRAVWLCDDIAYTEGLMVSPDYYRRYVFPWHKKVGDLCRRRNLPLIYHSDGDLRPVLEDIIANGVNVLHPVEPKAMDIVALKKKYGDVLAFAGNVDLGYTLTRGTPAEVTAEVRQKIKALAPGGGYLLGSSNSIPEYVPLANFEAMCEAALEYGRYPIRL
jgi:uroporphyrinogen decarboxylase